MNPTYDISQQLPIANFKPKSEWKHEGDASYLFVYLPGYAVEKLRITPDYSNGTVKVDGNRRLPNNKLSPVDETFNIPQNCDLSKMEKQFGPGILTLKIPKSATVSQQQISKQTMEEHQNRNPKPQETVADSMIDPPPKQTFTTSGLDEQRPDKAAMEEQISVMRAAKNDEEKLVDANGSEAKPESRDEAAIDEKTSAVTAAKSEEEKLVDDNGGVAKPAENPDRAESLVQNKGGRKVDEESKAQPSKQSLAAVAKKSAMNVGKSKEQRKQKSQKWGNSSKEQLEAKKGNEETKLIMNMGLVILILMVLVVLLLCILGAFMVGLSSQTRKSV